MADEEADKGWASRYAIIRVGARDLPIALEEFSVEILHKRTF